MSKKKCLDFEKVEISYTIFNRGRDYQEFLGHIEFLNFGYVFKPDEGIGCINSEELKEIIDFLDKLNKEYGKEKR